MLSIQDKSSKISQRVTMPKHYCVRPEICNNDSGNKIENDTFTNYMKVSGIYFLVNSSIICHFPEQNNKISIFCCFSLWGGEKLCYLRLTVGTLVLDK